MPRRCFDNARSRETRRAKAKERQGSFPWVMFLAAPGGLLTDYIATARVIRAIRAGTVLFCGLHGHSPAGGTPFVPFFFLIQVPATRTVTR